MKTKAPVGLEPGDTFETVWGDVEIIEKDGDNYTIKDKETKEVVTVNHSFLVEVMQGYVYET